MDAPVVVVIAAVPERAENLQFLLDDLSDQTHRITSVQVVLNGWSDTEAEHVQMLHQRRGRMFPLDIDTSPVRRSAGHRWSVIAARHLTQGFVAMLDDDLRVHPDYLKRTIQAFDAPDVGMVSWTGHALEKKRPYYGFVPRPQVTPLWIAGAGTGMLRAPLLQGLLDHPLAPELLASGGDDEALVSLHLWERGYRLLRPAGALPVRSVTTLQESSTASHKLHGPRWEFRRSQLRKQYGWGNM